MIFHPYSKCMTNLQYTGVVLLWGHRGRVRMVVGFTTTCAISAYLH